MHAGCDVVAPVMAYHGGAACWAAEQYSSGTSSLSTHIVIHGLHLDWLMHAARVAGSIVCATGGEPHMDVMKNNATWDAIAPVWHHVARKRCGKHGRRRTTGGCPAAGSAPRSCAAPPAARPAALGSHGLPCAHMRICDVRWEHLHGACSARESTRAMHAQGKMCCMCQHRVSLPPHQLGHRHASHTLCTGCHMAAPNACITNPPLPSLPARRVPARQPELPTPANSAAQSPRPWSGAVHRTGSSQLAKDCCTSSVASPMR